MPQAAAVAGAALPIVGGLITANADQNAADAQNNVAQQGLQYQEQSRTSAVNAAAPDFQSMMATQDQLSQSHNLLSTQLTQLQSQQALYNQVNSQASALLNGQSAASLAPLQAQIDQQKVQLQNSLRAQLGSGYAATSAGQEALNQFALQSENATVGAQQTSIQNYLGDANQLGNSLTQGYNSAYSTSSNIEQQGIGNLYNDRALNVNAITGTPVNFNNAVQTAGAPWVGQAAIGGVISGAAGSAGSISGLLGSSGATSPVAGASSVTGTTAGGSVGTSAGASSLLADGAMVA